jgi:hypothetical protein
LYEKFDKNLKPIFFRFCLSRFGRFSVRGVKKYDKKHHFKTPGKNLPLALFWPLTHPPTTGVTDFVFGALKIS